MPLLILFVKCCQSVGITDSGTGGVGVGPTCLPACLWCSADCISPPIRKDTY
jgi:hypothetical protein